MVVAFIQILMSHISFTTMFLQVLMVGFIYAGILIGGLLPFEILLFVNHFWRKRFEAVFGLKTFKQVDLEQPNGTALNTGSSPA